MFAIGTPTRSLIHRSDDNPETVTARLATYEQQTRPLIDYYQSRNLLHVVDGARDPEVIYRDIEKIVTSDE